MKNLLFVMALCSYTLGFSQKVDVKIKISPAVNPTALQFFANPQNLPSGAEITNIILTVATTDACRTFLGAPTTPAVGFVIGANGPFPSGTSNPNNTIYVLVGGWSGYTPNVDNLVASIPIAGGSGTCSYTGLLNYSYSGNDGAFYVESGGLGVQQNIINEALLVALPLEITAFSVSKQNNNALLTWKTASEKDVSHFNIERSRDGATFTNVGLVKAAGNSSVEQRYAFVDETTLGGVNYYRIKAVDMDGKSQYSKVQSLNFTKPITAKTFPNPLKDDLSLEIDVDRNAGEVFIEIFNAVGKQVYQKKIQADKDNLNLIVPTSDLPVGAYLIRLKSASETWQQKVTKI